MHDIAVQPGIGGVMGDLDLVRLAASGNEGAFMELVSRHRARLYGVALGIVRNQEEAEDVLQDSWIKVRAGLARFRGDSSLATWLTRVAMNASLDRLRRINRERSRMFPESVEDRGEMIASDGPGPDDDAILSELEGAVRGVCSELPPRQAEVFEMKVWKGMKFREIGRRINCKSAAARSCYFRTIRKLRLVLAKYSPAG